MAVPTIVGSALGFPANFGQHIQNLWSSNQGDSVVVSPAAGNTLVVVVFGLDTYQPFDLLHTGNTNAAFLPDLLSFSAAPAITDTAVDAATITNVGEASTALTLTSVANASAGSTVYTGTITGGAANALAGYFFTIAGFVTAANNGFFICTASTATTLTLTNAAGVSETHAATATPNIVTVTAANNFNVGDIVTFAGLTTKTWLNGQSQAIVTVSSTQFTTNDSTKHATAAPAAETGTATRSTGNDWVAAGGQLSLGDADYTASLGDFTRTVQWSLDQYFPSVYMFYALNVTGGTYRVSANTCYQDGVTRPSGLAAGKPVFDGGVDIHVLEFSGVVLTAASDGAQSTMTSANPAVAPSMTTTASGDLILTAGLMKSANAFSTFAPAGTTGTVMLAQGKCVGSEAHWGIQMQLQTSSGAILPGFTNPLRYEMAVKTLALKHS